MIRAAIAFFALALIALLLGAGGVAGISMDIATMLLIVFLVLSVISFLGALITNRGRSSLIE